MPRLRVLAGPSVSALVPITELVNTNTPHHIASDIFDGQVVVNIRGLADEHGTVRDSEYLSRAEKKDITWSIQVQGRFLQTYSADDILFGNIFDRPLHLPWGSGAIFQFMHFIDPTLEHDLNSQRPWALSPLISTMPHFVHRYINTAPSSSGVADDNSLSSTAQLDQKLPQIVSPATLNSVSPHYDDLPPFPPASSIEDEPSRLYLATASSSPASSSPSPSASSISLHSSLSSSQHRPSSSQSSLSSKKSRSFTQKLKDAATSKRRQGGAEMLIFSTAKQRRSYFSDAQHRQNLEFGPSDCITTDFCYGFLEFSPTLSLRLPGGLSFDLMKYWDGQPVRFVCCERKTEEASDPWGRIFWCVAIELVDDEAETKGDEERGEAALQDSNDDIDID